MRKPLQYDVRCYDLPASLAADLEVRREAPDPTGTVIWRHRISCPGEKSFNALMHQFAIERIAYDVKIVVAKAEPQNSSPGLAGLKSLFLWLILFVLFSFVVICGINSPQTHQWAGELEQKVEGLTGLLVKNTASRD